jgi:putative ABC transport system ATP-binding protein
MEDFGNHADLGGPGGDRLKPPVIHCRELEFSYGFGGFRLRVPELDISPGEKIALTGPSGCGKTTLIHLFAGILKSGGGLLEVDGVELAKYSDRDLKDFRILRLGLIFQQFELLQYLNSIENILLPFRLNPVLELEESHREEALRLLERVGLKDKADRYPKALSQGERQRVAVCRALIAKPPLLLCDEPTANLDPENRDRILEILFGYCHSENASLLMVTHDHEILHRFDRAVDIREFLPEQTPAP